MFVVFVSLSCGYAILFYIISNVINRCRSRFLADNSTDLYDNVICIIPTAHGVHIITHSFDLAQFRYRLENLSDVKLSGEQINEICNVKKDNPTLLYFNQF